MKYLLSILFLINLSSCYVEEDYPQAEKFQEMLDHLELDCPSDTSEYYFKAEIGGQQVCYFDGIDGMYKQLHYTESYTTDGPSTANERTNEGHNVVFGVFPYGGKQYQDWIKFKTPLVDISVTKEQCLDSLFAIPYHKITDRLNKKGISVALEMMDKVNSHGGLVYSLSSDYGYQGEGSYIHFTKVIKTTDILGTYYDIEMEVQCGLYYCKDKDGRTQFGKEGLWNKLENGLLKIKVRL